MTKSLLTSGLVGIIIYFTHQYTVMGMSTLFLLPIGGLLLFLLVFNIKQIRMIQPLNSRILGILLLVGAVLIPWMISMIKLNKMYQ